MKQRRLGAGGPTVSALGFGCLSFGGIFGPTTEADSLAALDAAWEAGITFLDTANIYGKGVSETVIGRWLASRPHRPAIATKAAFTDDPNRRVDNRPEHLRRELEASLKRLGVDHVALFYAHRHDPLIPIEDVAGTMSRLVDEGKIGGYGLSEIAPHTLERAHAVHPVTAVQNEYSLWTRQPELGMIQRCASLGVAFVPFSPLARGAFGTPMADPARFAPDDFRARIPRFQAGNWPHNRDRLAAFHAFARVRGWAPAALALAWVLSRGDHLIPIPGTRSAAHLRAWAAAPDIVLTEADQAEIDRLLPVGWAWGDRYDDAQAATVERYC
ncbi:aldo/keto reductase [Pseudogemmobacter blasticus]|uniref:Aldo/keto reductase n=1 Tax=Fuscovulum blasticum DSM 2131 TaxID=1188250 RepID=A0A2T4JCG4_FUSBL|nr:aldo/keto reductase [Fuscovulum blasticum]PTE15517.1 aldo/keto reductase [Fuscovulum blasticum DSM 2131]